MSNTKDTGIAIEQICLVKADVAFLKTDGEKKYSLRLTTLQRSESPDGKSLNLLAGFNLMHEIKDPLLRFSCEFIAKYKREGEGGMLWKDFSNGIALAHIIPYLREFVSNMTTRLPIPTLIIAPINTNWMIDDYEARKVVSAAAKAVPHST